MDAPLKIWYCDVCGDPITNPNEAIVTWKEDENYKAYDFKITHKNTNGRFCDDSRCANSMELIWVLGNSGLVLLTSFMSRGFFGNFNGGNSIKDLDNFTDFFRRVQLPYYEEARKYFDTDLTKHEMQDSNEVSPYLEDMLKRIIEMNK